MKRSICLPSSLLAALLLLSVPSGATETHAGRKLVWDPICAALDTGCSVSCAGSGYELYTYDCSSDTCKCFNNQVAAVIDKAKSCFPGDALVHTPGGGRKPMSELRVGDKVLTVKPSGEIEYNTVFMFTSHRPDQASTYVHISTDSGSNITLTHTHFLYARRASDAASSALASGPQQLAGWSYLMPAELRVGDSLLVADAGSKHLVASVITALATVEGVGLFNPHTRAGAIVVDGVVASELTAFVPRWAAGPRFNTALVNVLRAGFAVLPRSADAYLASLLSGMAHGTADAFVDRAAFLASFS